MKRVISDESDSEEEEKEEKCKNKSKKKEESESDSEEEKKCTKKIKKKEEKCLKRVISDESDSEEEEKCKKKSKKKKESESDSEEEKKCTKKIKKKEEKKCKKEKNKRGYAKNFDIKEMILSQNIIEGNWSLNSQTKFIVDSHIDLYNKIKQYVDKFDVGEKKEDIIITILIIYYLKNNKEIDQSEYTIIVNKGLEYLQSIGVEELLFKNIESKL
jgi:hypothetical protein